MNTQSRDLRSSFWLAEGVDRLRFAVCFTNFGPYHLARLRALGAALREQGGELLAYEVAGREARYPWEPVRGAEPFRWTTLFPNEVLEDLSAARCRQAMRERLVHDEPHMVAAVGYSRPESLELACWSNARGRPCILMSETQEIDHPRFWWKEAIKARRVRRFSAAVVGGPRHRDYLVKLGMPASRIALGYNAVDHDAWQLAVHAFRACEQPPPLNGRPYFIAINRFVPEKNLARLVRGFHAYLSQNADRPAWDLVLCGDGPERGRLEALAAELGLRSHVHFPGFLQQAELIPWLASASAFVHPSLMEPWGLVGNEAAACGLPLLISERAGCAETLIPEPGSTGRRFDPTDEVQIAESLAWVANLPEPERLAMAHRARDTAAQWGPERFASGTIEAMHLARQAQRPSPTGRSRHKESVGVR